MHNGFNCFGKMKLLSILQEQNNKTMGFHDLDQNFK